MNDLTVAHGDIRTVNSFPLPVFPYFYLIVLDAVRSVVGETVRSVFDVPLFRLPNARDAVNGHWHVPIYR